VTDQPQQSRVYQPEDRDDLRDGLLRGYREHMARLAAEKEAKE
jgi:hypothetical protein